MANIEPFGSSSSSSNINVIKMFGCTVIDFNVSMDWGSQGGSLQMRLLEDDSAGDAFVAPVIGQPALFQMTETISGVTNVLFEYVGLVDSISRSVSNSKIFNVSLASSLKILDATNVILDGYAGFGGDVEGSADFSGMEVYPFGHRNSSISAYNPGQPDNWFNVSNLINVFAIWENDNQTFRTKLNNSTYGGYGFSSVSEQGMPVEKILWALHYGINYAGARPASPSAALNEGVHGGNLLYGRHNYNTLAEPDATPYYYHFDALHFYNQISSLVGADFRISGPNKTLNEIVSEICTEANLDYFSYIDINTTAGIGAATLQESDTLFGTPQNPSYAVATWPLNTTKFTVDPVLGKYGGTIRIATISKNRGNYNRPFSNIAYNLIGLEVPDIKSTEWTTTTKKIHPGVRPLNNYNFGLAAGGDGRYADPLGSVGRDSAAFGQTRVGTQSSADGGDFPETTGEFDYSENALSLNRVKNSDMSLKSNEYATMKVLTGGPVSRLVTVPNRLIRHYWGNILVPKLRDPYLVNTPTDSFGLNQEAVKQVPIVTPQLDPRDITDFILIDMKSDFDSLTVPGVFYHGVYAASMLEIRCAMAGESNWKAFVDGYKFDKVQRLKDFHFLGVDLFDPSGVQEATRQELIESNGRLNASGGLGYVGASQQLGLGNTFALYQSASELFNVSETPSGDHTEPTQSASGTGSGINFRMTHWMAEQIIKKLYYKSMWENVKTIGDLHYGKSWYAPVPYLLAKEDLDGNQLGGNFTYSWQLTDSAYVEPNTYYTRAIPQTSKYVQEGKVSPHVNYNHNFITGTGLGLNTSYGDEITTITGRANKVLNFSEYEVDDLCHTRYGAKSIIHASPENVGDKYTFLPIPYDRIYNRATLPFYDINAGVRRFYDALRNNTESGDAPTTVGQVGTDFAVALLGSGAGGALSETLAGWIPNEILEMQVSWPATDDEGNKALNCDGISEEQMEEASGFFDSFTDSLNIPAQTNNRWLSSTVDGLETVNIYDNARYSFPFVKFQTARVFLPQPAPGYKRSNNMGDYPSMMGFNAFMGTNLRDKKGEGDEDDCDAPPPAFPVLNHIMTMDNLAMVLTPFKTCVPPYSFSYCQVSDRHVYGPWFTNWSYVAFRGKVEYEQDDGLVPENFLIPLNYGNYGNYNMSQISGLAGMNLAAQGRVNAIDNFNAFAVEEGSVTIPGAPLIRRIGEALFDLPQITDIKINMSNNQLETTYTFKTQMPKFGKNNKNIERKISKLSSIVKGRTLY